MFSSLVRASSATVLTTALVLSSAALASAAPAPTEPSADPTPTSSSYSPFDEPDKSIAFYVGKDLTTDGHPLLGGFGHEPSSHWLEIVPAQTHPDGSTVTVGATEEAAMPGKLTEIPQVPETYRYITANYSEFAGFPAPLTNGGLNEKNVSARDVWSNSREELLEITPTEQTGPSYSDMARFAMERASTAREAVEVLGGLIDEHGYTTYGGNSHLIADENEGWVFVEFAGGEGLWAAERLASDEVRVSYPGYIHDFPTDAVDGTNPDYLSSANLVSFAEDQGWYDADSDDSFNTQDVYGEDFPTDEFDVGQMADPADPAPYRNPVSLGDELQEMAPVSLEDMMRMVRDPRWSDDRAGYGHVAELRDDLADPDLATLWVAPTAASTAPYIPITIGTTELPVEFSQHRYLTAGASANYLSPEYAEQEATEYATQTYKRLMYATCARPDDYLPEVTAAFEGFEAQSLTDWQNILDDATTAYDDGDRDKAAQIVTEYSNEQALDGLELGNYLLDDILDRSRANGGIKMPEVDIPDGTTASARSLSMAMEGISSRDRMNCDVGGGWADGSTLDRQGTYGDPADVPDYKASSEAATADESSNMGALWIVLAGVGGLIIGAVVVLVTRKRA